MFTAHLDLISDLRTKIPAFAYLYNKYEKLEQEITHHELHLKSASDLYCSDTLIFLKQQKKELHDEIYKLVKKIRTDNIFINHWKLYSDLVQHESFKLFISKTSHIYQLLIWVYWWWGYFWDDKKAQKYNINHEISGFLVSDSNELVQLIEGNEQNVDALFNKIKSDSRHHDVEIQFQDTADNRIMPFFGMGLCLVNSNVNYQQDFYFTRYQAKEFSSLFEGVAGEFFRQYLH